MTFYRPPEPPAVHRWLSVAPDAVGLYRDVCAVAGLPEDLAQDAPHVRLCNELPPTRRRRWWRYAHRLRVPAVCDSVPQIIADLRGVLSWPHLASAVGVSEATLDVYASGACRAPLPHARRLAYLHARRIPTSLYRS